MASECLMLLWNGQSLGCITEVLWSDFPWASGRFDPSDWPSDLRDAVEWLANQAETEDEWADPPPHWEEYYEGCSVVAPDGMVTEIGVPVVDFEENSIEWR